MSDIQSKIRFSTRLGDIEIGLYDDKAPKTVENILAYVDAGHFAGTTFHRVIPGFVVQGGGLTPEMEQKPTRAPIENEANNGLKNKRGTLSMARTPDPHSATSQFFINLSDNAFLDFSSETPQGWGYAVFGEVINGMDVVDKMATLQTGSRYGHQDVPVDDVLIDKAERID
ncbi:MULTISPECIES: peptidylprolyl isomerase [unclassified Guyparkeria]|uniref:peptidylprolyl isomerase n=1 Tax=unclassified Guyparkeria TaxID=2626246 RepID=UPI0007336D8C|nr:MULTISPECIES: peptidylprolyl isomerase [unclassified Guyparkeria]KTG15904.1 hypothetical protein AUR63_06195 [Guyparkeria sp. XI15]OAE84654.1 cyclophilin [Guyparkeria sp. WRN-7]